MNKKNRILELSLLIEGLSSKKSRRSIKKLNLLKNEQFQLLEDLLFETDPEFVKVMERNFDLLQSENLHLSVYQDYGGVFGSYATKLTGAINNTGFLFLECEKGHFALLNFESAMFAKAFSGKIDCYGRTEVFITKKGFRPFGKTLPESFEGNIDRNGNFSFELKKARFELFGSNYTGKIVCDVFVHNPDKKNEFLTNKFILLDKLKDLKRTIENENSIH
jgi:hypothetical protein